MAADGDFDTDPPHAWKKDSIEERSFGAGLICLEGHYTQSPVMGPSTTAKVMAVISRTLEKTHTFKDVRELLSRNLKIWIWLRRAISAAICDLNEKSLGVRSEPFVPTKFIDITAPQIMALIMKNYAPLKEALQMLNKLMHIARNLLVTTYPEIPQDLSAAVNFDHEVYEAICLCVNVTSKGIDGEMPEDDASRAKCSEIQELYKKVLVTSLQQAHNWVAKNDRNKMAFWFRVLIESPDVDNNHAPEDRHESVMQYLGPRSLSLRTEITNWLERNSDRCETATAICKEYLEAEDEDHINQWFPQSQYLASSAGIHQDAAQAISEWHPEITDSVERDHLYGRVSHELDEWWEMTRLPNSKDQSLKMWPLDFVPERIKQCEANLMQRYATTDAPEDPDDDLDHAESEINNQADWQNQPAPASTNYAPEYDEYEEDADDDDSYGEGPMTGLLTEVPNVLDPKQIEALHMIVKSCILESAGAGLTPYGESLQHTRCKILLATDCGKNLLREMLVFIAVWEKEEQSLIFQISSQIVQAIHESSLIPYAWEALRSPKDIISPAQTVLLRLITYLSRTAFYPPKDYNPRPLADGTPPPPEDLRLAKMLNFLYGVFRSRIVPECVALMQIQADVRKGNLDPADFPVDTWDLERAKDGLVQYLDFLYTIADIHPLRQHLIEYEAVYELIKLLEGLDEGVEKIPLIDGRRNPQVPVQQPAAYQANPQPPPPPPPPLTEPPYEFPWSGIKGQLLSILAALLQPPPGQSSPGNPTVQLQIVQHNGIVALLNCCLYDDNNRFCRERVQLCLKWLMDGSPDASAFLQNLVAANPGPMARPSAESGPETQSVRIDGVGGDVRVQVRSSSAPVGEDAGVAALVPGASAVSRRNRGDALVNDIMALAMADDPNKIPQSLEGDETEEDDFMPYIARPSRSQQLSNPKLVPKLTEAVPPELQKKEGVADQQLAKLEAERARKRELERDEDDNETSRGPAHRERSASYDSVSTVSTSRSLSRSPRPSGAGKRAQDSRSPSPVRQRPRRSSSSVSDGHPRRSMSPIRQPGASASERPYSRDSRSPQRESGGRHARGTRDYADETSDRRSWSRSASPAGQRRYRSRSPDTRRAAGAPPQERQPRRKQGRGDYSPPRRRSLSPFSKRQALTQTMDKGR